MISRGTTISHLPPANKTEYQRFPPVVGVPSHPQQIGKYRVVSVLGAGGMGVVYEVVDPVLKRRLALKMMLEKIACENGARERFLAEAQAMASVIDDHVVSILDYDEYDGNPYLVMPLLTGHTLEHAIRERSPEPLSLPQAIQIADHLAQGLAAVHQSGLIHRDIKPANIWLETHPDGSFRRARLMDFGIARPRPQEGGDATRRIGTVGYMPLEQLSETATTGSVGPRSDLFSLGVVFYRMLTGRFPYSTSSEVDFFCSVKEGPPDAGQFNRGVPSGVSCLISAMLAETPSQRPESARGVVDTIVAEIQRLNSDRVGPLPNANQPVLPTKQSYETDAPSWLGDSRLTWKIENSTRRPIIKTDNPPGIRIPRLPITILIVLTVVISVVILIALL